MRGRGLVRSLISVYDVLHKRLSNTIGVLTNQFGQRTYSVGSGGYRKIGHRSLCCLAAILPFIFLTFIASEGYFQTHLSEELVSSTQFSAAVNSIISGFNSNSSCDVFSGKWVYDKTYPLYNVSECPFAEHGFRCQNNGRKDQDYMKWRWKPLSCDIPRFNPSDILQRLQGLRVVFVGDSMARTQWESLICLLMQGVADKRSVYEINGKKITKLVPFLRVRFSSFNFTIEYYRSPFLVQKGSPPKNVPKRVHRTLKLDKMDDSNKRWLDADILIFNSGHWWTPTKTYQLGCYFQVGDSLKLGMKIEAAYQKAISTWASWVESAVNTSRTHVFFRSFEPSHWSGSWDNLSCKVSRQPISNLKRIRGYLLSQISWDVIARMKAPVTFLNVTTLSAYRTDAHIGKWSDKPDVPDCSHWCLPGVPDIWNEMLFSSFFMRGRRV
ncbi:hypothetical protein SUGI_0478940 [Cryptomeria japonica]|uniref:protein trichome berefringence-like 7 n=1 Tax=Cryptomeria japonica TaxID=3369 RepID=UPI002408BC01|nr:protein trichome berefringence-like 7 [Cryptomeria japonica]GLJ25022.1 hypothetical protein SUGI_0478940 [Cryptomeria japonica]